MSHSIAYNTTSLHQSEMTRNMPRLLIVLGLLVCVAVAAADDAPDSTIINVWPGEAPGEPGNIGEETNLPPRDDELPTLRLTNVTIPTLEIFKPDPAIDTGAAVVICPGGGHHVLAYDKEGTEVAEWLNTIGVTGIVLKYRVPAREEDRRWRAAVQDAQRAMRVVRAHADEWQIDPERIGILGFSAGGQTAALTSLLHDVTQYESVDEIDEVSARPDFTVLIYTAGLYDPDNDALRDDIEVDETTPPMFFVHAMDDRLPAENSILMCLALKQAGIPCEMHIYGDGGHGFGLRDTGSASATWPTPCAAWLHTIGVLSE